MQMQIKFHVKMPDQCNSGRLVLPMRYRLWQKGDPGLFSSGVRLYGGQVVGLLSSDENYYSGRPVSVYMLQWSEPDHNRSQ